MTIQELARRASVTVRTIRYYVGEGLLPPPKQGRPSEYTEEHLHRLNLIRDLKAQYLPLEEIREIMSRLTLEQVEEMLARTRPVQQRDLSSAADYIESVLRQAVVREETMRYGQAPRPAPLPTRVHRSAPPAPPAAAPPPPVAAPSPDADRTRLAQPAKAPTAAEVEPAIAAEESTWQRVTIAPGIELHYKHPVNDEAARARISSLVARLLRAARRILEESPEKERE